MRRRFLKVFAKKPTSKFVLLGCGHFLCQGLYLNKLESGPRDAPC